MQVTGANLVPFTLQKQNLVVTVLGDLLAFASVFAIRLERVEQQSPFPGSESSTASLFIIVQQDDRDLFIPEVTQLYFLQDDLHVVGCAVAGLRWLLLGCCPGAECRNE